MPLRLAVFSVMPWAFELVREWAEGSGHEVVMLVTKPGRAHLVGAGADVVAQAAPSTMAVVTPMPRLVAPLMRSLDVSLGISFVFPKLDADLVAAPRCGTVNLHPALLPDYRGPNIYRALYEGEPVLGATLHWATEDIDCGPVLSQAEVPVPDTITPDAITEAWRPALESALTIGVPRAARRETGESQVGHSDKRAAPFADAEALLDWGWPARQVMARSTALLLAGAQPWAVVDGSRRPVRAVRLLDGPPEDRLKPGSARRAIVAVPDGYLEVAFGLLPFRAQTAPSQARAG